MIIKSQPSAVVLGKAIWSQRLFRISVGLMDVTTFGIPACQKGKHDAAPSRQHPCEYRMLPLTSAECLVYDQSRPRLVASKALCDRRTTQPCRLGASWPSQWFAVMTYPSEESPPRRRPTHIRGILQEGSGPVANSVGKAAQVKEKKRVYVGTKGEEQRLD